MEEDLKYLSENVEQGQVDANINSEFLKQNGLVIQAVISDDNNIDGNKCIFTPLAYALDKYALNYMNEKYQYSTMDKSLKDELMPVTKAGTITARFG